MNMRKPTIALVGRPNVGKSTLFNRITGKRTAIVEDIPGTTRDRIYGESNWNGSGFNVIDTGGLEAPDGMLGSRDEAVTTVNANTVSASTVNANTIPMGSRLRDRRGRLLENNAPLAEDSALFTEHIQNQAQLALDEADAIIFVVDGKEGLSAADEDVAGMLRRTDKPVFLAVNKTESPERRDNAVEFWNLGIGEPYTISAYHGYGVADLLDEVVKALPHFPAYGDEEPADDTIAIALVGRPNVGKSSLLNQLFGQERAIVSDIPGTTRDPVDTDLVFNGQKMTLIDTAGIRRRGKVEPGIERYSVLRSMRAIDRADVALLLIDATQGVTAQDAHVAGYIIERFKGVIVVVNKWDALEKDEHTMVEFTKTVRADLKFLDYVPVIFISALTGQRTHRLLPAVMEVVEARRHRIGTGALNRVIQHAYDRSPPKSKSGRRLRLYYATQADIEPPTFAFFINDKDLVHFSYERYLENQLRVHYPFTGTPLRLFFRPRQQKEEK